MGTRHLTCVVKGGDYKVAQYGQWDGYPSGQGIEILNFLRDKLDRDRFFSSLDKTFEPTDEQIKSWWMEVGHDLDKSDGFVDSRIAKKYGEKHPSLSRDTGGRILEVIQNAREPVPVNLNKEFAADSLFCEYAYVVDFDKETFEVFKGFNKEPLEEHERFAFIGLNPNRRSFKDGDSEYQYHQVRHIKTYDLNSLPADEEFLADLEPQDEEE
ncbi:hypothetical protein [Klebsiella quasipneumoniae]|uniref:hypothetical protein n=1 Tax=Klebsiella quasipneumoniae TaxID=1463165 RepID=UPI00352AFB3B